MLRVCSITIDKGARKKKKKRAQKCFVAIRGGKKVKTDCYCLSRLSGLDRGGITKAACVALCTSTSVSTRAPGKDKRIGERETARDHSDGAAGSALLVRMGRISHL